MNKAEMRALLMWAVKWTIAATIVVMAFQGRVVIEEMRTALLRHNQLVSSVVREFQVAAMKRAEAQKVLQELTEKDDLEPTEEPQ